MGPETATRIFELTCRNRYFEINAAQAVRNGRIKTPTYFSLGQEHIPAVLAVLLEGWLLFPQHRCHSYFLSFGGPADLLAKELLGREDGCNGGRGGSASVSWAPSNYFGHSGLLGDQIPIGVGAAHASGKPTLIVAGDAAVEEDYALGALGYAVTKKAPVLILVEDNDLSILTKKNTRRSWEISSIAKAFGLETRDIDDDPYEIYHTVLELKGHLPALLNVRTCRHLWHSGAGKDGEPEYNRFDEFRRTVMGADEIESHAKADMEALWGRLLAPSGK